MFSARVISVIETKCTRGVVSSANPVREVVQYWDFEGNLICEKDSYHEGDKVFDSR